MRTTIISTLVCLFIVASGFQAFGEELTAFGKELTAEQNEVWGSIKRGWEDIKKGALKWQWQPFMINHYIFYMMNYSL